MQLGAAADRRDERFAVEVVACWRDNRMGGADVEHVKAIRRERGGA